MQDRTSDALKKERGRYGIQERMERRKTERDTDRGNKKKEKKKKNVSYTHTHTHTHTKRERDVGIICVKIYDDLALKAWTQKREKDTCTSQFEELQDLYQTSSCNRAVS